MTDTIQQTGLGAASTSSKVPLILAGVAVLAGIGIAISMANRAHKETVEEEAVMFFPGPHGSSRMLAYRANVTRCFYRELRREHGYSTHEAIRIAQSAVDHEKRQLVAMSRVGKSVASGCSLLRRHAPRVYRQL